MTTTGARLADTLLYFGAGFGRGRRGRAEVEGRKA
jgi:hypothetical protein